MQSFQSMNNHGSMSPRASERDIKMISSKFGFSNGMREAGTKFADGSMVSAAIITGSELFHHDAPSGVPGKADSSNEGSRGQSLTPESLSQETNKVRGGIGGAASSAPMRGRGKLGGWQRAQELRAQGRRLH